MQVTVHLMQQATITFTAAQLWPLQGSYTRFGPDLSSFAEEVTRRLQADGFIGYHADPNSITVIPVSSVKRLDFVGDGAARPQS